MNIFCGLTIGKLLKNTLQYVEPFLLINLFLDKSLFCFNVDVFFAQRDKIVLKFYFRSFVCFTLYFLLLKSFFLPVLYLC